MTKITTTHTSYCHYLTIFCDIWENYAQEKATSFGKHTCKSHTYNLWRCKRYSSYAINIQKRKQNGNSSTKKREKFANKYVVFVRYKDTEKETKQKQFFKRRLVHKLVFCFIQCLLNSTSAILRPPVHNSTCT